MLHRPCERKGATGTSALTAIDARSFRRLSAARRRDRRGPSRTRRCAGRHPQGARYGTPSGRTSAAAFYSITSGLRQRLPGHEKPFLFSMLWQCASRWPVPGLHAGRGEIQLLTKVGFHVPFVKIRGLAGVRVVPSPKRLKSAIHALRHIRVTVIGAPRDSAGDQPTAQPQPGRDDDALYAPRRRPCSARRHPDFRELRGPPTSETDI